MKITASSVASAIKEYLIMTFGMFLYAFGWVACIIPAGGMGGGATVCRCCSTMCSPRCRSERSYS